MSDDTWQPDGLHPLRVQLRHRGAPRRGRRSPLRAHPRRQGPPGLAGLHVREGAAPRPLPERSAPPDDPAAPPRRRHLRGDRLGHRDRRGRRPLRRGPRHPRRRVDLLLRRRRPGEPPRRRLLGRHPGRARLALPVQRARAGEDGRVLGQRQDARHPRARRLRARRGRAVRRQEPVAVPRHPARPHDAEGDRPRPGALADRDRPAAHRDRRPRRLPPPGAARHRRLVPRRAGRGARGGGPRRPAPGWRRTPTEVDEVAAHLATVDVAGLLRDRRRRRGPRAARPPAASPARGAWPCSRTSACRCRCTPRCRATSRSCCGCSPATSPSPARSTCRPAS